MRSAPRRESSLVLSFKKGRKASEAGFGKGRPKTSGRPFPKNLLSPAGTAAAAAAATVEASAATAARAAAKAAGTASAEPAKPAASTGRTGAGPGPKASRGRRGRAPATAVGAAHHVAQEQPGPEPAASATEIGRAHV